MTDKRPKCKLCGSQHRFNEPHLYVTLRQPPPEEVAATTTKREAVTLNRNAGGRGKKVYETPAAKQKAYRERNK